MLLHEKRFTGVIWVEKRKRRFGDRKDGYLLRDIDAMHFITGIIYPNRCDNEAYISERIDLTNLNAYIAKKNESGDEFKYTLFHAILTAIVKTITLRPKMNRFIQNSNLYMRNEVSAAFIVKKQFTDSSEEGLAFIHAKDEDNIDSIHESIRKQVFHLRKSTSSDSKTQDSMDILNKMPRFLSKALVHFIMFLDRHGWCPNFLIESDPYYSSVVISNLGSIKLKSGYHHLTNWGTTSLFCIIGEKAMNPVFKPDGTYEMRETLDLGLTIDERLADGYYYSKTIKLLKKLLEEPELLDTPANEEVNF